MAQQKTAKKIKLAERRQMATDLRKTGLSFRQIAAVMRESLGIRYNESMAYRDVTHTLNAILQKSSETAEELLTLELTRLDDLFAAWWPQAVGLRPLNESDLTREGALDEWLKSIPEGPDKDAAKIILGVMARRAKMTGLDKENVNLFTPKPIVMAQADLTDVEEEDLDRIIVNLQTALGVGISGETAAKDGGK